MGEIPESILGKSSALRRMF